MYDRGKRNWRQDWCDRGKRGIVGSLRCTLPSLAPSHLDTMVGTFGKKTSMRLCSLAHRLPAILAVLQLLTLLSASSGMMLIPSLSSCRDRMTAGEERVAKRLQTFLDPGTLLWYEPAIGATYLKPDFVVFHPDKGLLVLEVKDWKLDNIESCNPETVQLREPAVTVKNPLAQARRYAEAISNLLQKDQQLLHPKGHEYSGRLCFPYGYGVILSNISSRRVEETGLDKVIEPRHLLCQNDLYESADPEAFQRQIWGMLHLQFGQHLDSRQVDRIRWHLFPDIRIDRQVEQSQEVAQGMVTDKQTEAPTDKNEWSLMQSRKVLRMMDLQQEQLARSLGEGHRVIHGVAGSGKTLIMLCRAEHLARTRASYGPILILCFNVVLASKMKDNITQRGVADKVTVRSFHVWCKETLQDSRLPLPRWQPNGSPGDYPRELFERVQVGVAEGNIPSGRYASIAVDEVHDFEPQWLKLLVGQVKPETNSLLLLYDDAQKLYGKNQSKPFSFRSVGVQAQGRTNILRLNYRNTEEILRFAYSFARVVISEDAVNDEDGSLFVLPETAGRHGFQPELVQVQNDGAEIRYLVDRCKGFVEKGSQWSDIAILYRSFREGQRLEAALVASGVPVDWCNRNAASRQYDPNRPSIKLLTMHSAKGLEFPVVMIPAVDRLSTREERRADEVRLLYVAMTRAIEHLIITYRRETILVERLLVARATATL